MPPTKTDNIDPIGLFEKACMHPDIKMLKQFSCMIRHLYQYKIFKNLLDLTATKIHDNLLSFQLFNQRFFDLDEGNCKTIFGSAMNKLFNKMRTQNVYQITIKKLHYEVIIHEIAHMIEKEAKINLDEFITVISKDIAQQSSSLGLNNKINQIFVEEIRSYPNNQRGSEFFARYFQLLCAAKEVSGLSNAGQYSLKQALDHFEYTNNWINQSCAAALTSQINIKIANASAHFITNMEEIRHKWSEQKVHSIHEPGFKRWSGTVNSIKGHS